jgi:hypothetical protein
MGGKYTITDDGREDVQKLTQVVIELPNIVNQNKMGGQTQKPGMQQTAGNRGPTSASGMGASGQPSGSQGGNVGQGGQPNKGNPGNR